MHEKLDITNLKNRRSYCKIPDAGALDKDIECKVINMRNQRPVEKGHIVNISHLSGTYSSKVVDALNEQVQSLSDAVTLLEQRLSVLEEELKNNFL